MDIVTILWSLGAAVAIVMSAACGALWLIERRDIATLMLCVLGLAIAALAYIELGMMHSATPAEYGEWVRWNHLPSIVAHTSLLVFVYYYLGTGRLWLMCAIIFARAIVVATNFLVDPNFNFSKIVSLRHVSFLGQEVSIIDVAVVREWQWFALASLFLMMAYLIDAAAQSWLKGGAESKRKALAVSLGMVVPLLGTNILNQLVAFGFLHIPLTVLVWFLGTLLTMAYELGRDVILNKRERLELAELRIHLAQVERVTAMGQLASTLAHELLQPLTASATNVEAGRILLKREKLGRKELDSILDDIGEGVHRASEIIDRMRQLFKQRAIALQPLSVEDLVDDVVSLVRAEANAKHVELRVLIQPGLPHVLGDRVHFSQVLLNLLLNSIQAVQARPPDARRIFVEARANDATGEVEMAVRDSGPGVTASNATEIFKPFFTTKSNGMGIGLALSRTIIEAHGGRLWLDNSTGQEGALFRFTLRSVLEPQPASLPVANSDPIPDGANMPVTAEEGRQEPTLTLGDVLYAKSAPPVSEQEWATLVQSIAAGDQIALHRLYEMAHHIVFTLIMRITANREIAETLTIDVFHDVWRGASRYDAAKGTVLAWIMNQARSRAIHRMQFDNPKKYSQGGYVRLEAVLAADPDDMREQSGAMRTALAALTPDEREAIETTFFAGLTHAEAEARLNLPLGIVKTRIRSGLHRLRHKFAAEAENHELVP